MPSIGNLHIYNEDSWLMVGLESVLKKSTPTRYVLGFSTDTRKIWVFDITEGWIQARTGTVEKHSLLGEAHEDTEKSESIEEGDLIVAKKVDDKVIWGVLPKPEEDSVLTSTSGNVGWSGIRFISSIRANSVEPEYSRRRINFIEGAGVSISINDDEDDNEVDVTIGVNSVSVTHNLLDSEVHQDTNTSTVSRGMLIVGKDTYAGARWDALSPPSDSGRFLSFNGYDVVWNSVTWSDVSEKPNEFPVSIKKNYSSTISTRPQLNFIEGNNVSINITDDSFNDTANIEISVTSTTTQHGLLDSSVHTDTTTDYVNRGDIITGIQVGYNVLWGRLAVGNSGQFLKSNGADVVWDYVDWNDVYNKPSSFPTTWDDISNKPSSFPTTWDDVEGKPSSFPVTVRKNSGINIGTRPRINFIEGDNISITIDDDDVQNELDITISATASISNHTLLNGNTHTDTDNTTVSRGMIITGQIVDGQPKWKGLSLGGVGTFLRSNGADALWSNVTWNEVTGKPSNFPVTVRKNSGVNVGTRPRLNLIEGSNITLTVNDDSVDNEIDITISSTVPAHNLLNSTIHADTDTTTVSRGMLITGQLVGSQNKWKGLPLGANGSFLKSNGLDVIWSNVTWGDVTGKPSIFPISVRRGNGTYVGPRPRLSFIEGSGVTITVADDPTSDEIDITINSTTLPHGLLSSTVHSDTSTTSVARGMIITGQNVGGNILWKGLALGASQTFFKSNGVDAVWSYVEWNDITNKPTSFPVTIRKNSGTNVGTRPRLNFIEGSNITLTVSDDASNNEIDITISASGGTSTHNLLDSTIHTDTDTTTVGRGMIITGQLVGTQNKWKGLDLGDSGSFLKSNGVDAIWDFVDWNDINNKPNKFPITVRKNSGSSTNPRPQINFIEGAGINIDVVEDSFDDEVQVTISSSVGSHGLLSSTHNDTEETSPSVGMIIKGTDVGGVTRWAGLAVGTSSSVLKSNGTDIEWGNVDWNELSNKPNQFPVTVRHNGINIGTRPNINFVEGSNITLMVNDDSINDEISVTISSVGGAAQHNLLDGDVHTDTYPSTVSRGDIITGQEVYGETKWKSLSIGNPGTFLKSNGTDVLWGNVLWDDVGSKPDSFPIKARKNSGTAVGPHPTVNFIEDTGATISVAGSATLNAINVTIKCEPFSESKDSVQLNAAYNLTASDTIITASSPLFQQVISTAGKWFFIVTLESVLRVGLASGTTSGTGQILIGVYKKEGTTETLIRNLRANYQQYFGSGGTNSPLAAFNSVQVWIPITITYTGTTIDIGGNIVNGTVLFLKGRYTTTTGVNVLISQILSTSALDAVKYNK